MTLEDFFTLTEMKDGLTSPSRVQELVSVMQKEQDCAVKNAGDATRQWAAVASTIAATENKDCLDLFIKLDGLWFINRWLTNAQKFGADTNDGFIEESITAMLRAVEKLYLESEKSISSEIRATVSNLLGHHSSKVQDRARVLFDNWKGGGNGDAESHDTDIGRMKNVSDKIVREEGQLSSVNEAGNDDDRASELVGSDSQLRNSDIQLPEKVANVQLQGSDSVPQSTVSLDSEDIKERSDHLASVLTSVQEIAPISEGEMTLSETCNLPVPKQGSFEGQLDDLQLNDLSKKEKQVQNANGIPEKLGAPDISSAPIKPEPRPVSSSASETKALVSVNESAIEHKVEGNEDGLCHKITVSCSMRTPASDGMSGMDDARAINSSNPQLSKASENYGDCCSNTLQDSSVSDIKLEKPEVLEMSFLKTEYDRAVKEEGKGQVSNQGDDTSNSSDSFKQAKGPRSPNIIDKSSDMELEYGIVDALEVARQVAQEVEREYVGAVREDEGKVSNQGDNTSHGSDSFKRGKSLRIHNIVDKSSDIELEYGIVDALEVARQVAQEVEREINNSSSEKSSESGSRRAGSPHSIGKKDELACDLPEEVSSRQSNYAEACSEEEGHMSVSDDIEAEPECTPDLESSQVTEAARDPGGNSEKSLCTFDLNEEVGSDDMDVSANATSTMPIPVVSASKPAQTFGLPTAPLQFEGTLGWKGSAATSAFRPASPRKNSDSEKNVSVGGNSDISKQRQDCLDIDLNVAECEEGLVKQIGESSGLPSGQSSVELSPKRSRGFELDLNSVGDDGDTQPSNQRMEGQLFSGRNGYWSPSPASSSSSMQPSVRNIDLNDRPYFQTDLVDQGPTKSSQIIEACGLSKSNAPVISLLGAKVEVGRRECVPQIWSLPNGKAVEPAIDLTMSGAGGVLGLGPTVSYNHSTVFGYNGLTSAPPLSFSSAMYGSGGTIPYMVDSRGAPVVPQVGGSSPTVLSSYAQPPFIMSMSGTQLGLNGVGPSRPNFDLNSGFLVDGGNRDALAARPFFFPAQGRAMEEHVRTLPQSSSSGVGGKRKEPDGSWETYPFNYKHHQPPWK
ncbi:TFIIS/LEDGF domain superfamily [Sesbania bispinosa]|nr:TFIIS/LEDGF domain superfamily [Sesbania bispinosa]